MDSLAQFLEAHPDLKFVFTGGKGGVGKTVTAAGLALYFAGKNKRVLLASLNPVHSLSSVFDQDLAGGKTKAVQDGDLGGRLQAVEVETKDVVERYRENIGKRVREFLKWSDIPVDAKPFVDIAVTNPAFEESAMFDKMTDVMLTEGSDYDVIVFDTAAVANAIRLIGLSKIYGLWLGRMIESRKEALSLRVQLSFRKEKIMEEVKKDPLMGDLIDMNDRFNRVKDVLLDPKRTAFFFVTLPLALPISVVERFIESVKSYGVPVGGVVVNSILPREVVQQHQDETYLANKFEEQQGYLRRIKENLGPLVRAQIPQYEDEVRGMRSVQKLSKDMFEYEPDFWTTL
jgi:arsenite-transporting ATPase